MRKLSVLWFFAISFSALVGHSVDIPPNIKTIRDLPPDWVTDGVCAPNIGMHFVKGDPRIMEGLMQGQYLHELISPLYNEPVLGFDVNGDLLFLEYNIKFSDLDDRVNIFGLPGVLNRPVHHIDFVAMTDPLEAGFPPFMLPILCGPDVPEDKSVCTPHYDVYLYFVDQERLSHACDPTLAPAYEGNEEKKKRRKKRRRRRRDNDDD